MSVLAHVDAGKTTLSEAMLYTCGSIRTLGRVDHKSSFLDTGDIERSRGITVFSKTAMLEYGELSLCLLDTPGHVDFSPEAERCLSVSDCALLVISGSDGVQAHTETLWRLLKKRGVPCFIFVTKTDLATADPDGVMTELRRRFGDSFLDFNERPTDEALALCDETLLDRYMETGAVTDGDIAALIQNRKLFPVLFGSGLKLTNIDRLMELLALYTVQPDYGLDFGARVIKILRDSKGSRLTLMKLTGGRLSLRDTLRYVDASYDVHEEKVTELRIYSGAKYEKTDCVLPGGVCAVKGLSASFSGQGFGFEADAPSPELEPVMEYAVRLLRDTDPVTALEKLRTLEEEEPSLHLVWKPQTKEIGIRLMGKMQTEVIVSEAKQRFDLDISIDSGSVMYRETILAPVTGAGHFEPLRHYAEVHLELSPLPVGEGLEFTTRCAEDALDRNWQRLILSQLAESELAGVLTGSPITDMRISLIAGRAHLKHTEGGDFREAAHRALRQALMKSQSRLLEPWYDFRLEVPSECIGRAIGDLRDMSADFEYEVGEENVSVISGVCPVSEMSDYAGELASYTGGRGRLTLKVKGYLPCHNEREVVERIGYDPASDPANTADSVFCSHGAGRTVSWELADEYMHIDTGAGRETAAPEPRLRRYSIDDRELEAILEREFGPIRRREYGTVRTDTRCDEGFVPSPKDERLIIDGYNLIFGWDEMNELAKTDLGLARERLIDRLCSYAAFKNCEPVLVFDGYKVKGGEGERDRVGRLRIAYTKENETADMYIEKLADEIGANMAVKVVTNDSLIRLSALRSGVLRMPVKEFVNELLFAEEHMAGYGNGKTRN